MTAASFDPEFASPAEWARMYRAHGLQVVPSRYPMKVAGDKRPALSSWGEFHNEIVSDAIFDAWFPADCRPNMGVITGAASAGLLVVDLDLYKGAQVAEWWESITNGFDPETWVQTTGGGGKQYFFRVPTDVGITIASTPIADIRCQGGFAMLPPSRHMSGKDYDWNPYRAPWECEIMDAPETLLAAIRELIGYYDRSELKPVLERTDNPATDLDAFGNRVDGREKYMSSLIWAAVLNLHRQQAGIAPEHDVAKDAHDAALQTYLRNVRTRLPGYGNLEGLEREGRGPTAFLAKWRTEMRKWDGKVAKEAAKPNPRPFDNSSTLANVESIMANVDGPAARPVDPETGKPLPLIQTAGQFVRAFTPPAYVVDGIIQRGYIYSLTGRTGHGKTAIMMLLAQCVARGLVFHDRDVKQGGVLVLAGENPDDVRARFLVLAEAYGFDPETIPVYFVAGVVDIAAELPRIREETADLDLRLVIVDTAAAYFKGDDGNSNAQQGAYARLLRELTFLPGKPAVVVPSHPVKNASKENLLPVGGGAFLNEVDGNLTLWSDAEGQTSLSWQGKFRGPEFNPLTFKIETKHADAVVDEDGRLMPSVVASPMSLLEADDRVKDAGEDLRKLLGRMAYNPKLTQRELCQQLGWMSPDAKPQTGKVSRLMRKLEDAKSVARDGLGKFYVTDKGRKALGLDDE